MPALSINDVGTWRQIRKVYVNDLGTWRQIRKVHVNDLGTWRLVFQNGTDESGSITAGTDTDINTGFTVTGYFPGLMGSKSFSTFSDGRALYSLYDHNTLGFSIVEVSGFTSNPGQEYLLDAFFNSVHQLDSAVAAYSYGTSGSGIATWQFNSLFGFASGNTYPGVVTHL